MRRSRADGPTKEIAANLRARGVSVAYTQGLVPGFPDLVVAYRGRNHLLEIKRLGETLSEAQVAFSRMWNGCVHVATNSAEAFAFIVECRQGVE